ncbi:MAG: hypothetical protein AAFY80_03095 [Pseudomonadota bacterium]
MGMVRLLCLCLALTACASPSPRFMGAERSDVVVDGMRFAVFRRGSEVEVFRLGPGAIPRQRDVFTNAITAITQVTGCDVRPKSMTGDAALVRASLDCPAA